MCILQLFNYRCCDMCDKLVAYLTNEILRNANEIHFIPTLLLSPPIASSGSN